MVELGGIYRLGGGKVINTPDQSMMSGTSAAQLGLIPVMRGPIRFAVGPPNGLTSNSWRVWTTSSRDVYVVCRDNFKEAKVSLHASGRWRMGFTTQALDKHRRLLPTDQNRAWEVWDRPPPILPNTVIAFRLIFPSSELGVRPEQRKPEEWARVVYIEAPPQGKVTVVTLFITAEDVLLTHESEPSFCLASLEIGDGQRAQLIAHGDPEGDLPDLIRRSTAEARKHAESKGVEISPETYGYFLGRQENGSRFIFGAYLKRDRK